MSIEAQEEAGKWQYDLGMEELEFKREVEESGLSEREEWDLASRGLKDIMGSTGGVSKTRNIQTKPTTEIHPSETHEGGWLNWLEETYPDTKG
jgi:hypothetical protein